MLTAHGPALPQPDQLCGPFAAWAAVHAVTDDPPSVTELALAAGTRVWPHEVPAFRPPGAPFDRTGWEQLPVAASIEASGTDARGVTAGVAALCGQVGVVPAGGAGDVMGLLAALIDLDRPVGVVANLRTGLVAPPGLTWDVGHFVVLWGVGGRRVALADSYVELGAPGLPPGCRLVDGAAISEACAERGLLVLVDRDDVSAVGRLVAATGFTRRLWTT